MKGLRDSKVRGKHNEWAQGLQGKVKNIMKGLRDSKMRALD
jgi:hypothetical protein